METVPAPRAAEPDPARALQLLNRLLRVDRLLVEQGMRQGDVILRRLLGRGLGRIESDEQVGGALGQVLE